MAIFQPYLFLIIILFWVSKINCVDYEAASDLVTIEVKSSVADNTDLTNL
jgi:hypothetical protein